MEDTQSPTTLHIVVGSKNPVKLRATSLAFAQAFPHVQQEIQGQSVPSGVADQPASDPETLLGARQRAEACQRLVPEADYWVGLEGGIAPLEQGVEAFAWMYVLGKKQHGKARSASFLLPPSVVALLDKGMELGVANDQVFGRNHSKQKEGAVGLLTRNLIDRTELYSQALLLALVPFLNPSLFPALEIRP